jgi:hypothetical protein
MEAEDVAGDGRKTGEEEVTMANYEIHDPRNEDPWNKYPKIGKDGLIACKTVHNTTQAMPEGYVELSFLDVPHHFQPHEGKSGVKIQLVVR